MSQVRQKKNIIKHAKYFYIINTSRKIFNESFTSIMIIPSLKFFIKYFVMKIVSYPIIILCSSKKKFQESFQTCYNFFLFKINLLYFNLRILKKKSKRFVKLGGKLRIVIIPIIQGNVDFSNGNFYYIPKQFKSCIMQFSLNLQFYLLLKPQNVP